MVESVTMFRAYDGMLFEDEAGAQKHDEGLAPLIDLLTGQLDAEKAKDVLLLLVLKRRDVIACLKAITQ